MATKESVQPTVNAMRSVADNLMLAAKRLENNHAVLPDEIVKAATEAFDFIMSASNEYCTGIIEAVHSGNELGREAKG